ncbi:MAG: Short-chain-enoyl-CoA hydratase [Paracidovorax wautersii]|uniref:Short-chain-enoyl-CoA hydratase n=1 Tax=Paracidovorax wautersii TaxID=1177982 RepID=A0A7V8FKN6_9BURK|nr:MAG: Short-chain-enoyl-CoA hydratase [Paracidovorax wautersii]
MPATNAAQTTPPDEEIVTQIQGRVGYITLNRPRALNALSLGMVRRMLAVLREWAVDDRVAAVALRGQGKEGPFGLLCAGGDIRFLHQAALAGDSRLDDFFTEEYTLNHLIHTYPKPYIAFMDGVVMGGGMGVSQGAGLRIVTERTRMAMPETAIGLFPDVGGGFFLSRTPGRTGEYLALTGNVIGAADAVQTGLADIAIDSQALPAIWDDLADWRWDDAAALRQELARRHAPASALAPAVLAHGRIDEFFGAPDVGQLIQALESADNDWARETAATLRKRSPLMLQVVLELIRRARTLGLADDLRLERSLVRRCFTVRPGAAGETVEGIRALAVDKDHQPRWNPARIEEVTPEQVAAYFEPVWSTQDHPLRELA